MEFSLIGAKKTIISCKCLCSGTKEPRRVTTIASNGQRLPAGITRQASEQHICEPGAVFQRFPSIDAPRAVGTIDERVRTADQTNEVGHFSQAGLDCRRGVYSNQMLNYRARCEQSSKRIGFGGTEIYVENQEEWSLRHRREC